MNLAIKGHETRGKEVIEILEMMGGVNSDGAYGDLPNGWNVGYYIFDGVIKVSEVEILTKKKFKIYTLEEFLNKFPYKVGDKVYYQPIPQIYNVCISEIISMKWINDSVVYYTSNGHEVYACDLQPYKEEKTFPPYMDYDIKATKEQETMEEPNLGCIDFIKHPPITDEVEVILGDYEFVLKDGKTYFVKKIQYPKTYEECCKVLSIAPYYNVKYHTFEHGFHELATSNKLLLLQDKLNILSKLLICRDAYWKIAGEQMGLGKAWEPDFENDIYYIYYDTQKRIFSKDYCAYGINVNHFLVFPTEEMRDDFYENFKELIEQCKELL